MTVLGTPPAGPRRPFNTWFLDVDASPRDREEIEAEWETMKRQGEIKDAIGNRGTNDQEVLDAVDTTGDGRIDEEEFAQANTDGNDMLTRRELEQVGVRPEIAQFYYIRRDYDAAEGGDPYQLTFDLRREDLSGIDLRDLPRIDLSNSDLFEANLSNAYLDGAILTGVDAYRADFSFARMDDTELSGNFEDAEFWSAELNGARTIGHETIFQGADLSAHIHGATLYGDFSNADFRLADLRPLTNGIPTVLGGDFYHADFSVANLSGAVFEGDFTFFMTTHHLG